MKKWISILLAVCCLFGLVACTAEEEPAGKKVQLYYVSNSETKVEVRDYYVQASSCDEQVQEILIALSQKPGKLEYKAPLDMGFTVLDYKLENNTLTLNMDTNYSSLVPTTEILVRAALVCSLTQLEQVRYVTFTISGNLFYDNLGVLVGTMNADQIVNNMGSEISAYDTVDLTLYFANEAGDSLIAVNRKKEYNTNIALDRLVVEELLLGPTTTMEGVYPTINPAAKAISVLTKDGICYVNLDKTFLNQIYNVTPDVTIYSIVNSLAELSNINKVQISIDGDTSGTYREKYSFSTVFERNLDIVTKLEY